jgi:hypothetical protein
VIVILDTIAQYAAKEKGSCIIQKIINEPSILQLAVIL